MGHPGSSSTLLLYTKYIPKLCEMQSDFWRQPMNGLSLKRAQMWGEAGLRM
jgi:hypothetical protein